MAVTFSDLHTEAGLTTLEEFLSGKTFVSGDAISKDDVKVFAAVLVKPGDEFPNVGRWYETVAAALAKWFPGKPAGVKIGVQPQLQHLLQTPKIAQKVICGKCYVISGICLSFFQEAAGGDDDDDLDLFNNAFYGSSAGLVLGFGHVGQSSQTVLTNPISSSSAVNLAMTVPLTRSYLPQLPLGSSVDFRNPQGGRGGGLISIADTRIKNALMPGVAGMGMAGVTLSMGSPVNPLSSDGIAKGNSDLSSVSPVPYAFNGGLRGRKSSGAVEKVVERRQRRMIKNRESVARSRARNIVWVF